MFLILLLASLSCSSDGGSPADPGGGGTISTGPITSTITPAGGSIVTTTGNGAIVRVTFPQDAVRRDVAVTVRPQSPEAGAWLNVAFEPAYTVFFKDVTVTITAPEGQPVDDTQSLWLGAIADPWLLPTSVDTGARTVSTSIRGFGAIDTDSLANVPLALTAEMITPSGPGSGNNLGASPVTCQQHVANAEAAFDNFVARGDYESAAQAALVAAACLQKLNCPESLIWATNARQAACDGLTDAIINSNSIATEDFGLFYDLTKAIIYWEVMVEKLSAPCQASSAVGSSIDDEAIEFATFYDTGLNAVTDGDWRAYSALRNEAREVYKLHSEARYLAADAGADKILDDVFNPTVNRLRSLAYQFCADYSWHYPLSRLTSDGFFMMDDQEGQSPTPSGANGAQYANFEDDDIFEDLQLCATTVDVKSKVVSGGEFSSDQVGGTAPGQKTAAITMQAPTRGKLVFDGKIAAFLCWLDISADNEVVFYIDNQEVLTLRRSTITDDYLQNDPAEIDIREAILGIGQQPDDATTYALKATRKRTDCSLLLWGPDEFDLFTINLELVGPELTIDDNLPGQIAPGQSSPVAVRVGIKDQLGVVGHDAGVNVTLAVSGASASPSSGVTDANGYFNTTITAAQGPTSTANGNALGANHSRAALATITLDITAQADGITERKTSTSTTDLPIIEVTSQAELNQWAGITAAFYVRLDAPPGLLTSDINDLSPLQNLTTVSGYLQINRTQLTSLSALTSLTSAGDLLIYNNTKLTSLQGLHRIETTGSVGLQGNDGLANLTGLTSLRNCLGLTVLVWPGFVDFTGLEAMETIRQTLHIDARDATTFQGLKGLDNVTKMGGITIRNIKSGSAATLANFPPGITELGYEFAPLTGLQIQTCHGLTNFAGLENLTSIKDNIEISNNDGITSLTGLFGIKTVGRNLVFGGHSSLDFALVQAWAAGITVGGTVNITP